MPYLLILRIKTAYNMHLKIVLHIKMQFVSSDLIRLNSKGTVRRNTVGFPLPPCGQVKDEIILL